MALNSFGHRPLCRKNAVTDPAQSVENLYISNGAIEVLLAGNARLAQEFLERHLLTLFIQRLERPQGFEKGDRMSISLEGSQTPPQASINNSESQTPAQERSQKAWTRPFGLAAAIGLFVTLAGLACTQKPENNAGGVDDFNQISSTPDAISRASVAQIIGHEIGRMERVLGALDSPDFIDVAASFVDEAVPAPHIESLLTPLTSEPTCRQRQRGTGTEIFRVNWNCRSQIGDVQARVVGREVVAISQDALSLNYRANFETPEASTESSKFRRQRSMIFNSSSPLIIGRPLQELSFNLTSEQTPRQADLRRGSRWAVQARGQLKRNAQGAWEVQPNLSVKWSGQAFSPSASQRLAAGEATYRTGSPMALVSTDSSTGCAVVTGQLEYFGRGGRAEERGVLRLNTQGGQDNLGTNFTWSTTRCSLP